MSARGGRLFVHDYLRNPQELQPATVVGVELDSGEWVTLGLRDKAIELRGQGRLSFHMAAANVMEIHPERGFAGPSRIEGVHDTKADLRTAKRALSHMQDLAWRMGVAPSTQTTLARREMAEELNRLVKLIGLVIR